MERSRLRPIKDIEEWNEFMEALKAAKSEPSFKAAVREFKKKHGIE